VEVDPREAEELQEGGKIDATITYLKKNQKVRSYRGEKRIQIN
jgi:hypothetical protein